MSPPKSSVSVNIPPVKGAGGKVLGAIATATPQVTGESVQTTLEVLDKIGVKDDIEEVIQKVDYDTPEVRNEEEKKITRRIYRIDLLLSFFLFYTSLVIQWLTLLGLSTSFGNFIYNVFIGSFVFSEWDFSNISTVGKIAGVTTSLQIIIFIISNIIILLYRKFHPSKQPPAGLRGPVYFGGLLKFFNGLKPKIHSYASSVKKLDAQFSQILGVVSQILVIIAASFSADSNLTALNGLPSDYNYTNNVYLPSGFGGFIKIYQVTDSPPTGGNDDEIIAIKYAAGYAKTTLLVAILAIIMTAIMNVINWMVDIWKVNREELIVYIAFKFFTRMITCYPCFHDKLVGADEAIDNKTSQSEMEAIDEISSQKKPQLLEIGKKNTLTSPNVQTLVNNTISGPNSKIAEEKKQQQEEGSSSNEKKPDENKSDENKSDENKSDENKSDEKKSDENKNKSSSGVLNILSNLFGKPKETPVKENTTDALNNIITTVSGTSNNNDEKSSKTDVGKIASEGVKVVTSIIEGQKQSGSTDTKPVVDEIKTTDTNTSGGGQKSLDVGKLVSDGIKIVGNIIDGGSDKKLDAGEVTSEGVKVANSVIEGQKQSGSTDTKPVVDEIKALTTDTGGGGQKSSDVGKLVSDGIKTVGNVIDGGSDTKLDAGKIASDGVKVATNVIEGQKKIGSTDTKHVVDKIVSDETKSIATDIGGGDAGKVASEGVKVVTSVIEGQKQSGSTDTKLVVGENISDKIETIATDIGGGDQKSSDVGKLVSDGIKIVGNVIDGGSDTKLDADKIVSDGVKVVTGVNEGQKDGDSTKTS